MIQISNANYAQAFKHLAWSMKALSMETCRNHIRMAMKCLTSEEQDSREPHGICDPNDGCGARFSLPKIDDGSIVRCPNCGGEAIEEYNRIAREAQAAHQPTASQEPEEGDDCVLLSCTGKYGYHPVENCSCHINPPCSRCVDNPLVCLECGHDPNEDFEPQPEAAPSEKEKSGICLGCGNVMALVCGDCRDISSAYKLANGPQDAVPSEDFQAGVKAGYAAAVRELPKRGDLRVPSEPSADDRMRERFLAAVWGEFDYRHACMTGDCSHNNGSECDTELYRVAKTMVTEYLNGEDKKQPPEPEPAPHPTPVSDGVREAMEALRHYLEDGPHPVVRQEMVARLAIVEKALRSTSPQVAQTSGEDEGYPGIAHDLERYRTALEQIAGTGACRGLSDLDPSHAACIGIARAALQAQGKDGENGASDA